MVLSDSNDRASIPNQCLYGTPTAEIRCPEGTLYDKSIQGCNWEEFITCDCTGAANLPSRVTNLRSPTRSPSVQPTPMTIDNLYAYVGFGMPLREDKSDTAMTEPESAVTEIGTL
eukprot:scaffold1899_cov182-Alexandrium_tamarense.AAC.8